MITEELPQDNENNIPPLENKELINQMEKLIIKHKKEISEHREKISIISKAIQSIGGMHAREKKCGRIKNSILNIFTENHSDQFSQKDISSLFPEIKKSTIAIYLSELYREGKIIRAGRGIYSLNSI